MQRSVLLDAFRVLAIALVLIAHLGQLLGHASGDFFGIKNVYYVSLGGLGVTLFLILSGLLAGWVDASMSGGYFRYLLKKLLRIYPIYWLSLPFAVLGYVLGGVLMQGHSPPLFPNGFMADLLFSLSGFYAWAGLWGGPYNSPTWFIGLIMALYAVFPLLIWALKRWPLRALLMLLLISLLSRYYIGQEGLPFSTPTWYEQLKGWAYRQYGFMPGRPGDWFLLCRVFEFGLGIYLALKVPPSFWTQWQLPGSHLLQWLGNLSFAVFLLHFPFLFLVLLMRDWGWPLWLAISVYLLLLWLAAYFLYWLDGRVPRKALLLKLSRR